ncbi:hypothetical protein DXA21_21235 [Parabacteroides distasonis]|nr:hypothetical protein DXA21_21235 [Parabacteroides distasonis]
MRQWVLHDNYVISEKNPWTDYSLKPIEYKESNQEINKTVGAKSAILVDVKSKDILYQKNADERRAPASTTKINDGTYSASDFEFK